MPTRFSPPGIDSRLREELSKLSIEEMIEMLENSDMEIIPGLWKGMSWQVITPPGG